MVAKLIPIVLAGAAAFIVTGCSSDIGPNDPKVSGKALNADAAKMAGRGPHMHDDGPGMTSKPKTGTGP